MATLSTFRQLPPHIAEAIINYYVPPFQTYPWEEWLVLYVVSRMWRARALQRFYQKASLIASTAIGKNKLEFPLMPSHIKAYPALFRHVKEVGLYYIQESASLGAIQLNDFSNAWPDSLVFPTARFLSIDVAGFLRHYATICLEPEINEFSWIADRIRTSMPNLQKATIIDNKSRSDIGQESPSRARWNASNLLEAILERATSVDFGARELCPESIDTIAYNRCKLVQLEFSCAHNVRLFHLVVRASATTLAALRIRNYPRKTIKAIVFDDEDKLVVYPRLQQLHFHPLPIWSESENAVKTNKAVVVFPAMRQLTWISKYTFEDDTLFRGNSNTLEYLDIEFGTDLVNILERYCILKYYWHWKRTGFASAGKSSWRRAIVRFALWEMPSLRVVGVRGWRPRLASADMRRTKKHSNRY